jgi:hypothetical protein
VEGVGGETGFRVGTATVTGAGAGGGVGAL